MCTAGVTRQIAKCTDRQQAQNTTVRCTAGVTMFPGHPAMNTPYHCSKWPSMPSQRVEARVPASRAGVWAHNEERKCNHSKPPVEHLCFLRRTKPVSIKCLCICRHLLCSRSTFHDVTLLQSHCRCSTKQSQVQNLACLREWPSAIAVQVGATRNRNDAGDDDGGKRCPNRHRRLLDLDKHWRTGADLSAKSRQHGKHSRPAAHHAN